MISKNALILKNLLKTYFITNWMQKRVTYP